MEVCRHRQIAPLVYLQLIEARPAAIDVAALHRAAYHKHYVGVAVVGAAVAIFSRGAAEFGHGYYDCVFSEIAQVGPEGGDRLREISQDVGDLALGAAFVDMVVPASYVGEGYLHSQVSFDQLRYLLQAV